ncbi:MAG: hypothetical protein RL092_612, partial [Bacteroidota bacterium]
MRFILTLTLALAALVFHAQIPSYVPSDGLVGYWPFNGNANDESGNGKDLTNSGLTYGTDNLGQSDASAVFDGSSSVAYRLNDGDLRPSSYTISVWIKTDVIQSGSLGGSEEQHIVGFTPSNWNIGPAYKLALDITDNSKLMHRQWITTSGWIDILTPSQTINSNNWYHLVAVFDSFLGKQKLYINGVLNSEISSQLEYSGQEGFFVGGSHENASGVLGSLFHGKINDLGFWNRALAEQEITTLYTSQTPTVCVPEYVPTNGLVGYWPFCGNANDESGNGNDGVVNGDVPFVADRNNNPSSAMQGGAGYVSVSSGFFNFGYSDPFSVSVWFTQSEGGGGRLISTESPEGQFRISTYGSGLNAMQYGNSQNYIYDTISDLNWHNYTFLYNGFGQASKYVDGHFEGNFTINSQEALIYGFPFTIGAKAAPAFDKWNGKIDDVAVYNRILTQQEITTLYTGQTPTVCMPDYVPTNGLVGYWPFCGNANDESGNGNDGVVNGATLTIDRNGNANSAYSFDGISNYIDVGNPPMLLGVTESYTQAGWAYYNDYSTANNGYTFMSKRHDNSGNDWATAITRSDGSLIFFADDAFYTGAIWARTNPITLNQWHFLAFVKSQDNYSIYVDGVLASSIVDSHQMGGSSNNLIIGAQLAWPEYMKGSLDDIG